MSSEINPPRTIEVPRKPRKCPECGSKRVPTILYGYPHFGDQFDEAIIQGKYVIGGCIVTDDDPQWVCDDCGLHFKRVKPNR